MGLQSSAPARLVDGRVALSPPARHEGAASSRKRRQRAAPTSDEDTAEDDEGEDNGAGSASDTSSGQLSSGGRPTSGSGSPPNKGSGSGGSGGTRETLPGSTRSTHPHNNGSEEPVDGEEALEGGSAHGQRSRQHQRGGSAAAPSSHGRKHTAAAGAASDAMDFEDCKSDGSRKPKLPRPAVNEHCPRCASAETKFCYYNNYNVRQPRFFCKACQRYWTSGGTLRNVPPGSGRRKAKGCAPSTGGGSSAATAAAGTASSVNCNDEVTTAAVAAATMAAVSAIVGGGGMSGVSSFSSMGLPPMDTVTAAAAAAYASSLKPLPPGGLSYSQVANAAAAAMKQQQCVMLGGAVEQSPGTSGGTGHGHSVAAAWPPACGLGGGLLEALHSQLGASGIHHGHAMASHHNGSASADARLLSALGLRLEGSFSASAGGPPPLLLQQPSQQLAQQQQATPQSQGHNVLQPAALQKLPPGGTPIPGAAASASMPTCAVAAAAPSTVADGSTETCDASVAVHRPKQRAKLDLQVECSLSTVALPSPGPVTAAQSLPGTAGFTPRVAAQLHESSQAAHYDTMQQLLHPFVQAAQQQPQHTQEVSNSQQQTVAGAASMLSSASDATYLSAILAAYAATSGHATASLMAQQQPGGQQAQHQHQTYQQPPGHFHSSASSLGGAGGIGSSAACTSQAAVLEQLSRSHAWLHAQAQWQALMPGAHNAQLDLAAAASLAHSQQQQQQLGHGQQQQPSAGLDWLSLVGLQAQAGHQGLPRQAAGLSMVAALQQHQQQQQLLAALGHSQQAHTYPAAQQLSQQPGVMQQQGNTSVATASLAAALQAQALSGSWAGPSAGAAPAGSNYWASGWNPYASYANPAAASYASNYLAAYGTSWPSDASSLLPTSTHQSATAALTQSLIAAQQQQQQQQLSSFNSTFGLGSAPGSSAIAATSVAPAAPTAMPWMDAVNNGTSLSWADLAGNPAAAAAMQAAAEQWANWAESGGGAGSAGAGIQVSAAVGSGGGSFGISGLGGDMGMGNNVGLTTAALAHCAQQLQMQQSMDSLKQDLMAAHEAMSSGSGQSSGGVAASFETSARRGM